MEQARARCQCERLEDGERRHQEIETGAISWGRVPEDAKAFYALHRCGWDGLRIQVELTSALARHGKDLVRKLLRDLVSQARVECVQPDIDPSNSETFREELRLASGRPYSRRKCRSRAKEQFIREMLAPVPQTEANLDWRWLDPCRVARVEVASKPWFKPPNSFFGIWEFRFSVSVQMVRAAQVISPCWIAAIASMSTPLATLHNWQTEHRPILVLPAKSPRMAVCRCRPARTLYTQFVPLTTLPRSSGKIMAKTCLSCTLDESIESSTSRSGRQPGLLKSRIGFAKWLRNRQMVKTSKR